MNPTAWANIATSAARLPWRIRQRLMKMIGSAIDASSMQGQRVYEHEPLWTPIWTLSRWACARGRQRVDPDRLGCASACCQCEIVARQTSWRNAEPMRTEPVNL